MMHADILLLLLLHRLFFLSPAASVAVFPVAQTEEKLRDLQEEINELKTIVSRLQAEVFYLRSKALKVTCQENWFPVHLNDSVAFCVFASSYSATWDTADGHCKSQKSQLLSFGGEFRRARQLETAVRNTLSTVGLRGTFWLGLWQQVSHRLVWRNGSDLGPLRWHAQVLPFITQPCGVLWLGHQKWNFDDCRSSNRWVCIRQPQ